MKVAGAPMPRSRLQRRPSRSDAAPTGRRPTVVVLGAVHVGQVVAHAVRLRGFRCVMVDRDASKFEAVERLGTINVFGDAANPEILRRLDLERAVPGPG